MSFSFRRPWVTLAATGAALLLGAAILLSTAANVLAEEEPGQGAWFPTREFPADWALTAPIELEDGQLLMTTRTPHLYDPHSGDVQVGTEHPEARGEFNTGWRQESRVLTADGHVLVAGGTFAAGVSPGSTGSTDHASIYDPELDSWADLDLMPERRSSHSLILLDDASILVAGGEQAGGVQLGSARYTRELAFRYIPDEDAWEQAGELNEPRINHFSFQLDDGRVLIIGGRTGPAELASSVEVFDPQENTWEVLVDEVPESLNVAQAIQMPDDRILALGGFDRDNDDNPVHDGTNAWLLDTESGEFVQVESMNESRTNFRAALLADGTVLVTGGQDASAPDNDATSSGERYFLEGDEWVAVASMEHERQQHKLVTLDDDEAQGAAALVAGGIETGSDESHPELFYLEAPGIADRQPPPVDEDPAHRYFPPTGHYLSYGFKDFWETSGGLPVFGYPLTTEFDEFNPELDEDRTSQYFERQRFEYHPEHAGTPYEVQLGRLGYAEASDRGLLDQDAFQPVDAELEDEDRCHYFEATGFAVCNEFLNYWESHGLDFGDHGVSYRESLALFGYPISQEYFPEPGNGAEPVAVQYFERARFEFHPDNPEEYKVLLGRLGADIVEEREW